MRVTWVILTLGLLWTDHAQSEEASKAPTTTAATSAKVTSTMADKSADEKTTQKPTTSALVTATVSLKPTSAASTPKASTTNITPAPTDQTTTQAKTVSHSPKPPTDSTAKAVSPKDTLSADLDREKTTASATTSVATPTETPPSKKNTETPTSIPPNSDRTESTPAVSPTLLKGGWTGSTGKTEPTPSVIPSGSPTVRPGVNTDKIPGGEGTSGSVPTSTQPTTAATTGVVTTTVKTTTLNTPRTPAPPVPFSYLYNKNAENETILTKVCAKLLEMITGGNCSLEGRVLHNGTHLFDTVTIYGNVNTSVVDSHYKTFLEKEKEKEKERERESPEESDSTTLIAILASCGAVALIIVGLAIYTYRHGKNYRKNQQHLTEELQTVENGYHDNPTLEVMEVQQETPMEKRPNGEFNDSWIVPIDNLLKEELPDEEDTHL